MQLHARPLTKAAFAPFGEVIEIADAKQLQINQGRTTRFDGLCTIDIADPREQHPGVAIVNLFRTNPLPLPHRVQLMERHPLGTQAFIPTDSLPFLVLVGAPKPILHGEDLTLFITNGKQGVNFHKNTWHHPNIALTKTRDFIVIDRRGDGDNLQEIAVEDEVWIAAVE